MKLYWSLHSIPELHGLSTAQQRQHWRAAVRAQWHRPQVWGSYLVKVLVFMICLSAAWFIPERHGVWMAILWNMIVLVWGGSSAMVATMLGNALAVPVLRPTLAALRAGTMDDPLHPTQRH